MALAYGIDPGSIAKSVREFGGVAHRIEFVCEKDGVVYYNDSKGTNPDAAIQALIEYNLVGKVQVIGYYVTDQILQALRQDLIPVTMTIDTGSLGEDCVQALDEYLQLGRVSSYHNIALSGITPMTVEKYEKEHEANRRKEEKG